MAWYQLTIKTIEQHLGMSIDVGLNEEQTVKRLKQYGENKLATENKVSRWLIFLKQFQDFMVIVLLAATLIAGLLGEYVDAIAIMVIVFINGFMGYFQEQKAEKSLTKLKELSAPIANVKRDGEWVKIPSKFLVIGDVIRLTPGERIPADIRIVQSNGLELEESALTGESLPVAKHDGAIMEQELQPQDQHNMAFMGTMTTRGTGLGIVVGTGMDTVMGQIASLMAKTGKIITPLERKLAELGKILIFVALILTTLVVVVGVYQGHPVYNMFLAGVSLAVAAIPEGLPAIVTVSLSLGVQRMIRKRAIVRKLSAVETLGCASVICSDKTGTMTENKMTVKKLFIDGRYLTVTGDGYDTTGTFQFDSQKADNLPKTLEKMLLYGMICNHATLVNNHGKLSVDGDPTDGALLVAAYKAGVQNSLKDFKLIHEIPFDSTRKRMTVVVEDKDKHRFVITKGAPDVLLPRMTFRYGQNGRKLLKERDEDGINQAINKMAESALRTIAIGFKQLGDDTDVLDDMVLEQDLTFLGMYGIIDPPRKEVKQAIAECKQAGIKTVMITGDHEKTARAIATDLNILPQDGLILNGYQLNELSKTDLQAMVDDVYVFARVTPEHKLKIVHAYQGNGHVVAMTGDGVNDAPAIKASDIGVSMGNVGTDVAKEASSLVLMDDNFTTIKSAINEGRNIYENIRKFVRYLLASNVGEIMVMLFAMILALPLPLVPVQILWVNLVTDGLPAMALGLDKSEGDVMRSGPRNPKEGVFARGLGWKIISRGILIGIATLLAFLLTYQEHPDNLVYAQTVAFTTLVMAQLIHVFDCRSEHSIFSRNPFGNIYLVFACVSSLLLVLCVIYFAPLQPIFHTTYLGIRDWMFIIVFSALPSVLFGFTKR